MQNIYRYNCADTFVYKNLIFKGVMHHQQQPPSLFSSLRNILIACRIYSSQGAHLELRSDTILKSKH